MKIAHVISSCSAGGAEVFVKSLIIESKLSNPTLEIELWVMSRMSDVTPEDDQRLDFEKKFIDELTSKGIIIRFINKRPGKDLIASHRTIKGLFKNFNPDIVHTHSEGITCHICMALLFKKTYIVQTIHNTVINYKFLLKIFANNRVNHYVAISDKVRYIFQSSLNIVDEKIYLINNGIQLDKFIVHNRKINSSVTKILAVGRLTPQKDYKNLINAVEILNKELIERDISLPQISIVGEGELKEELKFMVADKHLDNVEFLGIRDDIGKLLAEYDLYVMSSAWEGLSISLIEALASGIPIVATDAGSNNEIIENEENGIIVPIQDSKELSNGILNMISNFDLRKKSSEKSSIKAKKFDISMCAKTYFDMDKDIMYNNKR